MRNYNEYKININLETNIIIFGIIFFIMVN